MLVGIYAYYNFVGSIFFCRKNCDNRGMSKASADLTNQVINHIYRAGGYAWRASSVGVFDTKQMHFRASAKKGVSDVLACYKGILVAIEVKIGKDTLSDEQKGFMRNIEHAGGYAIVATDPEAFREEWEKIAKAIHIRTGLSTGA